MDGSIIIADDDKNLRMVLTQAITRAGAKVRATATLSTLWRWLEEGEGDVVLCDVNLMDGDALELLPKMRKIRPDLQFVMMSAQNTVITALRATEQGAYDYLAKPFDLREMLDVLTRAKAQSQKPRERTSSPLELPLVGRSGVMQTFYRDLARVISSDLPVIIQGAAGTGKTLVAETIHRYGNNSSAPMVRIDGQFTSAGEMKDKLTSAKGGSVILDNIDEFLPAEQRELLHFIDGDHHDVRYLATSCQNLLDVVVENRFRRDLFERLDGLQLQIVPLIDRIEDIAELSQFFIGQNADGKTIGDDAIEVMTQYPWPGNVAELRNLVRRAVVMSASDHLNADAIAPLIFERKTRLSGDQIQQDLLSQQTAAYARRFIKMHSETVEAVGIYSQLLAEFDRGIIETALVQTGGNQIRAAELLGINRNTLRKKIYELDISVTKRKKLM